MQKVFWLAGAMTAVGAVACGDEGGQSSGRRALSEDLVTSDAGAKPNSALAQVEEVCNNQGGRQITIRATAPMGMSDADLGKPLDQHFERMAGEAGRTLFPNAQIGKAPIQQIEHELKTIDTTRGWDANVGVAYAGFGIGVNGGKSNTNRYAAYRASQVIESHNVDDTTFMRAAPPGSAWYISRIYYGRQYEVFLWGDQRKMNVGVKASIYFISAGVNKFAEENELTVQAVGRGLQPSDGKAIFAKSPEEVEKAYSVDGEPVPIMVEYRTIPRVCVPPDEQIEWLAPKRVRLSYDTIDVYAKGGDCWIVDARCELNDKPLSIENSKIWERKTLNDSCKADVLGPQGEKDYCSYNAYWATQLAVFEGDILTCGITGKSNGSGKPLPHAEFTYRTKQGENQTVKGDFGDTNHGMSYRVHYTLEFLPVDAQ